MMFFLQGHKCCFLSTSKIDEFLFSVFEGRLVHLMWEKANGPFSTVFDPLFNLRAVPCGRIKNSGAHALALAYICFAIMDT